MMQALRLHARIMSLCEKHNLAAAAERMRSTTQYVAFNARVPVGAYGSVRSA